ncbi:hypothetical protein L1049_022375 [Liquidambar formosana]|uniref:Uncharacterized protein n=1 Tax=Liquidambar formosana TaxID=63359 RepID=A0AAP0RE71_LIQFO
MQHDKANVISERTNTNLRAINDMKWVKLLDDVLMGENEAEEALAGNHFKIFLEFEDLIKNDGSVNEKTEQTEYRGSNPLFHAEEVKMQLGK